MEDDFNFDDDYAIEENKPYHSLKSKPFPIIHNGWIIHKVPFL